MKDMSIFVLSTFTTIISKIIEKKVKLFEFENFNP